MELQFSFDLNEIAVIKAAMKTMIGTKPDWVDDNLDAVKGLHSVLAKMETDIVVGKMLGGDLSPKH